MRRRAHSSLCVQASRARSEGGAGRKGRRRDAALTWEVPPQLELDFVKPAEASERAQNAPAEPAAKQRPSSEDGRPVHPLVEIQRRAFESPAQQHLGAVVGQLLRAESVPVSIFPSLTLTWTRAQLCFRHSLAQLSFGNYMHAAVRTDAVRMQYGCSTSESDSHGSAWNHMVLCCLKYDGAAGGGLRAQGTTSLW